MKNITNITLILLIIASCGSPSSGDKEKSAAEIGPMAAVVDSVTLNGYTFAQAETMVRTFLREGYSTEKQTSIWFTKRYIDSLDNILSLEGADGFRIYFAKKGGKNTIIMVSTKQSNNLHPRDSIPTHKDYFGHKSTFLQPGNNPDILGISENGVPEARLYSPSESDCTNLPCNKLINTISCVEGRKWVNQFSQGGPITTTSLWYPKKLIEAWKKELDAVVPNNIDGAGDGIRIYFAKNDLNRNVFVMTTTRIKNGQKGTDYYECYAKNLTEAIPDKTKKRDISDNGEECPNNCNDLTWQ